MGLKIKIEDPTLVEEFLNKEKFQRTSGRGPLADSWIISSHLKDISKKVFNLSIDETNITGVHIYIKGNQAIVSGVNFLDVSTIKNLTGKSFSAKSNPGNVSFEFGEVLENFKLPVTWASEKSIPLTFFLNSVVFEIKKTQGDLPEFYNEMTLNEELLKSLGRPVLDSDEVSMDCHMMDFSAELPVRSKIFETDIAKEFASLI